MRTILLFICLLIFVQVGIPQWSQTNGPEGTSVNSLYTSNGIIYVGTQTAGVFSSTDDGLTWFPKNSGIETFEVDAIGSIPGYLFAATFGHGVYRSTDGGQTWLPPSSGTNLASTGLVTKDNNIFVSSVNDGVYRSTDNGVTWIKKLFGWSYIVSIGVSGNKILASTDSYYILYSTDNGENWTYLNNPPGFNHWCYYTEGNLILIGGENEIYRSTDQGVSFTTLNLNINYGLVNVYAVYMSGSTIFAGTSYDGVYKSTDNGSTWAPANNGMGPKDIRALTTGDSSTIIAGSHYSGIYKSTDSGSSWNKSLTGIPPGSSVLSMLNSSYGLIVGTRDGMYETTNNGLNWMKFTGTNDTINYGEARGLCEKDGVIYAGIFLQFNSTVYRSSDNGATWIRSGNGLPSDLTFIFNMAAVSNNTIAATDEGAYYSSDNGNTWLLSNLPVTDISDISATDNYIYAIVQGYGIYQSANGTYWYPVYLIAADFISIAAKDNYAYSGTFFDGAIYTPNSGGSWYACSGFPAGESVYAFGPVGNEMVLAGTSIDPNWIYASMDYGVNFFPYSEGLGPNAITEHFAVSDSFMFAGTDYNGIWRRSLSGVTDVNNNGSERPDEFTLRQNYPNPFNPSTTIEYSIPKSGNVKLTVYNSLGEDVATLKNNFEEEGSYKINFDASKLSSGIYFYRLNSGNFSSVKKMVILK